MIAAGRWALLTSTVALAACTGSASDAVSGALGTTDDLGIELDSATYVLRLDRTGLQPLDDDTRGFRLTTDRGYEVRLTGAYLLQHNMSLVDCLGVSGSDAAASFRALFAPAIARAGHSEEADPSLVDRPVYVDLLDTSNDERELGSVEFASARYCRVHHLVGGSADHLFLRGSYRAANEPSWQSFRVVSSLAWGDFAELEPAAGSVPGGHHARVVLTRSVAHVLDGIDLASAEPFETEVARQVLRNLVGDATVTTTLE